MTQIELPEEINHRRRRSFGAAVMAIAAALIGMMAAAKARPSKKTGCVRQGATLS
jgi:hypothetical protein